MKIYEISFGDDQKEWVSGHTAIEALKHYLSIHDMDIHEMEDDEDIMEVPPEKYDELYIRDEDGLPEMSFAEWLKLNKYPDIIAEPIYE